MRTENEGQYKGSLMIVCRPVFFLQSKKYGEIQVNMQKRCEIWAVFEKGISCLVIFT